jgi:uncharacterized protein YrrD
VFDHSLQRIVSLHVSSKKRHAELIDWSDVTGFGPDAVVIESAGRLHEVRDDHESDAVHRKIDPIGARVLDDLGDQHGVVRDIRFDPESGIVEAIVGDSGEWAPGEVWALGSFALVVRRRARIATRDHSS